MPTVLSKPARATRAHQQVSVDASEDFNNTLDYLSSNLDGLGQEERISRAIDAVNASVPPSGGKPKLSLRKAAILFNVPSSTLTDRYNGVRTRQEAHEFQQRLTNAQENILAEWVKVQARRGVPISPGALEEYASEICGKPVGSSWQGRFLDRHPDLKVRWTQSLEQCRANNVNRPTVYGFFDILEELVQEFSIPAENIYNMDEKGIQLGVGKRVAAIVDRDQKNVYNLEHGSRELVTILETVCADGTALSPTVVFQGKKVNLSWTKNNPCHASVSCSPKGWTDQDLGTQWLKKDFEPMTASRNKTGGYRLLILDGHNSHCTYAFTKFAKEHKIIIICLPSHTTHVLQPCDVGVFGPLASAWKIEVNNAAQRYESITKHNLLQYYAQARSRAFKQETILAAFRKTGIWPLNRNALDPVVFEPALNTTTQASQPLPTTLPHPNLATVISASSTTTTGSSAMSNTATSSSTSTTTTTTTATTANTANTVTPQPLSTSSAGSSTTISIARTSPSFTLNIPRPVPGTASRHELLKQNLELFKLLRMAEVQIQSDHAQKRLMDHENEKLRQRLFDKEKKKKDKRTTAEARHLTSDESIQEGAKAEWQGNIKAFHEQAKDIFKQRRDAIEDYYQQLEKEKKAKSARKKKTTRAVAKAEVLWRKEMDGLVKYVMGFKIEWERKELREKKEKERAWKRAEAAAQKATSKQRTAGTRRSHQSEWNSDNSDHDSTSDGELEVSTVVPTKGSRKRPTPIVKKRNNQGFTDFDSPSSSSVPTSARPITAPLSLAQQGPSHIPIKESTPEDTIEDPEASPEPAQPLVAPRYALRERKGRG